MAKATYYDSGSGTTVTGNVTRGGSRQGAYSSNGGANITTSSTPKPPVYGENIYGATGVPWSAYWGQGSGATVGSGLGGQHSRNTIAQNVKPQVGVSQGVNLEKPDNTDPGGYTPRGGVNTSSMDSAYSSTNDDIVGMIKGLLDQQKKQADEYYKTLYEQQLAQNKQQYRANQDQINLNRVRGRNYINQLYGDAISGPGISNRVRNDLNWASNSASNRLNYTNNDATALASYNSGLANNASTLAQGWYNYVLPVYTNRQQTEDDYAYKRYLASL